MAGQSPVFVKTEAFMVWLLDHTRKFPKYERFRLARQLEDSIFAFHAYLICAAKSSSPIQHLWLADVELDKLRSYLRLALEMRYTSEGQYGYAAQQVTEIGKLLGGWLKSYRHDQVT